MSECVNSDDTNHHRGPSGCANVDHLAAQRILRRAAMSRSSPQYLWRVKSSQNVRRTTAGQGECRNYHDERLNHSKRDVHVCRRGHHPYTPFIDRTSRFRKSTGSILLSLMRRSEAEAACREARRLPIRQELTESLFCDPVRPDVQRGSAPRPRNAHLEQPAAPAHGRRGELGAWCEGGSSQPPFSVTIRRCETCGIRKRGSFCGLIRPATGRRGRGAR